MGKIKNAFPIILVIAYAVSAFYLFQSKGEVRSQYKQLIAKGDEFADNGVSASAIELYQQAAEIKDSVELELKIGNLYLKDGAYHQAENWYEDVLLASYPEDARIYEYGLKAYMAEEDYSEAFAVYDAYRGRGLTSEAMEDQFNQIRYMYEVNGEYDEVKPFSNLTQTAPVKKGEAWIYINGSGSNALQTSFQQAGVYLTEYAPVVSEEGKAFCIDSKGEIRITEDMILSLDPEFGAVKQFRGVTATSTWAFNGSVWNYYDLENGVKKLGGFADVTAFSGGIAGVCNNDGKWALINDAGTMVTEYAYQGFVCDEKGVIRRNDCIIAETDEGYRLINIEGKSISEKIYEEADAFAGDQYAAVRRDGKWLYIDESGAEYQLGDFGNARSFSCGLAAVEKDGDWGFINKNGDMVIEPTFYDAGYFAKNRTAFVRKDKSYWSVLTLYRNYNDQ